MTHIITADCIMCGACESECAEGAITAGDDKYVIDTAKCQDCGSCVDVCPTSAATKA
jgi:ferredoxin